MQSDKLRQIRQIKKKNKGITLLEIILSVAILLVIMGVLLNMFASTFTGLTMQVSLEQLHGAENNGRMALLFIARDTREGVVVAATSNSVDILGRYRVPRVSGTGHDYYDIGIRYVSTGTTLVRTLYNVNQTNPYNSSLWAPRSAPAGMTDLVPVEITDFTISFLNENSLPISINNFHSAHFMNVELEIPMFTTEDPPIDLELEARFSLTRVPPP